MVGRTFGQQWYQAAGATTSSEEEGGARAVSSCTTAYQRYVHLLLVWCMFIDCSICSMDLGFLQREADSLAPKAILKQLRRSPTPPLSEPHSPRDTGSISSASGLSSPVTEEEPKSSRERRDSVWSTISTAVNASKRLSRGKGPAKPWKVEVRRSLYL